MNMQLVKYSEITEDQYEDYIGEWEASGETIVPSASRKNNNSFKELRDAWNLYETDIMYAKGFVPATLYFYLDDENRIMGAIHLRHDINKRLRENGGHIGYGVRPSERKKGYASRMLSDLLKMIWQEGYEKVLITCDENNIASAGTIEKNGGVLWDRPLFEGTMTRRYWLYPCKIRKIEGKPDFTEIIDLIREEWPSELGETEDSVIIQEMEQSYNSATDSVKSLYRDGRIIGFYRYSLWPREDRFPKAAHVMDIALSPEVRHRGWGTLLMKDMMEECRRKGLKTLLSRSYRSNEASCGLHKSLGFSLVKEMADSFIWKISLIEGIEPDNEKL